MIFIRLTVSRPHRLAAALLHLLVWRFRTQPDTPSQRRHRHRQLSVQPRRLCLLLRLLLGLRPHLSYLVDHGPRHDPLFCNYGLVAQAHERQAECDVRAIHPNHWFPSPALQYSPSTNILCTVRGLYVCKCPTLMIPGSPRSRRGTRTARSRTRNSRLWSRTHRWPRERASVWDHERTLHRS
jgi:hypothetical protein